MTHKTMLTTEDAAILSRVGERIGLNVVYSGCTYQCFVHDANVADAQTMRECFELRNVFGLAPAESLAEAFK